VGFLKKVYDTPEFQAYLADGALDPAFLSGADFAKWVEQAEGLHKDLMAKGGLLQK
jgi:putative tricarboxylic transport membrane protein